MISSPLRALCLGTAGIIAGLLLGSALAQLPLLKPSPTGPVVIVPDQDRPLRSVAFHYRPAFHQQSIETISDFLSGLSSDVHVHVVVERLAHFEELHTHLKNTDSSFPASLTPVVTGFSITPWAKDRFGTMENQHRQPILAIPPLGSTAAGARANDAKVPAALTRAIDGATLHTLPFHFEGGDLLADANYVYLAANCLARNQPYNTTGRESLLASMSKALGKPIIVLGPSSSHVPDHHIGMYLTPLGNNTVAVGDPDLGKRLYLQLPENQRTIDLELHDAPYQPFRNVIKELSFHNLRIIHIPLLLTTTPRVYATYNNAILEQRHGSKRIFMPVYDIPQLDTMAATIFEQEGWKVTPVRVSKIFSHTGSLRCLIGIISRG